MISYLLKPLSAFPATFSASVFRKKYFTLNFFLLFSALVFCAQGLIAQELMSASYLPVRKEMAVFAMAALAFRTNTNFRPINTDSSQYSGTKNNPDTSLRPLNHLPDSQQEGCFSKVPKGDTEQLLNVLLTSPPGCTVEIEGTYFLDASIDIKVNLTGKSSLQEPEPDEPAVFFRIESVRTDSDQKTGFRSSVLSGKPLSYTRYPEAVLVMDENKDSRLRIHPSAKLNNITVLSPSTDFDPHRGCIDTRIIFQANAEPFIVGVSESTAGHLCHTYHSPSGGIISYGKTSTGTDTSQNSNNSGGKAVVRHRYTNAPYTASRGGASSSGGAGGDDRRPWRHKTQVQCLADIIQNSPEQKLKVSEIYRLYHESMQGSDYVKRSKENSIRQILSDNPCFQREAPQGGESGGFWSYDPTCARGRKSRQQEQQQQPVIGEDDRIPWRYKTLIQCIADIIQNSPEQKLKLSEIYRLYHEFMQGSDYEKVSRENSIRHALSRNPCFQREAPQGKGYGIWSYDPTFRKSTRGRKSKQQEQQPVTNYVEVPYFVFGLPSLPFQYLIPPPVQSSTFEDLFPHYNTLNTGNDEVGQHVDPGQIETSPFPHPGESYCQGSGAGWEEQSACALQGNSQHGEQH